MDARVLRSRAWWSNETHELHAASVSSQGDPRGLGEQLDLVTARLIETEADLRKASLEVQLGMAHSRVGLMRLASGEGASLSAEALQSYVSGWVRQMARLDPADQVLRWQVLRDPRHVLVSCIPRAVYSALADFAQRHELRFTGCVPAVIQAVRETAPAASHTTAWTEGPTHRRDPGVQFIRFDKGQPSSLWRAWIPGGSGADPQSDLEGALRRFQAAEGVGDLHEVRRIRWPESSIAEAS